MPQGSRSSVEALSEPTALGSWTRVLIPSTGDTIFISLLLVLTCTSLSMRLLGDAGIGWHIRTGQLILGTHEIPRVDPFSAVMKGKAWFAWEWLYDVAVGALERSAGLNGVVWFTAVLIATVFAGMFQLLLRRGAGLFVALLLLLLAASAAMIHALARPHVVSWLFTLAWFWILDSSEPDQSGFSAARGKLLWLLPFLMLVWVNIHGGFLVGFVLLAIYWVSGLWNGFGRKEEKFDEFLGKLRWQGRARVLAAVGVSAAAATLINPYGWKLHAHIFGYLSNRFLMEHIHEFQSPNFHGVAERCFAVLVLAAMCALAAKSRRLRVSEVLVLFFAVYSGFYAARDLPVSSLLLALVIGPALTDALKTLSARNLRGGGIGARMGVFADRMQAMESSLAGHAWPIAAAGLTFWIAVHGGLLGANRLMDAHFDGKRYPAAAVDFLDRKTVEKRYPVTVPDYWGGYLIYRLYPQTPVTVDDRHDLYGEEFLKSYLKMLHVQPGWDEFLKRYDARCVLVPKSSSLANILELTPAWKRTYADDDAAIFERPADVLALAQRGKVDGH